MQLGGLMSDSIAVFIKNFLTGSSPLLSLSGV